MSPSERPAGAVVVRVTFAPVTFTSLEPRVGLELADDPLERHQLIRRQRPERGGHVDLATRLLWRLLLGLLTRGQCAPASTVSLRPQDERCRVDVAPAREPRRSRPRRVDEALDDLGPRLEQRRLARRPVERERATLSFSAACVRLPPQRRIASSICSVERCGRCTPRARASRSSPSLLPRGDDLHG